MIIDELSHLEAYIPLHPALRCVADFLSSHEVLSLPDGRMALDYPGACVNVQTLPPKDAAEAKWESHRRMVDVQVPLTDDEQMACIPVSRLGAADYDAAADIAFYRERPAESTRCERACLPCFSRKMRMRRASRRRACARPFSNCRP